MNEVLVGGLSVLAICLLIYTGMHITVALMVCSFVGVWLIKGDIGIAAKLLGTAAADSIATYDLAVIPLFVLMGLLINATPLATDAFRVANHLLRRVRGGVGIATVLGNAVLSAVTGVTIASVAIFSKIAVPQMMKLGYKPRFAVGLVAGSGVLGMMIPPSLLIIIYCLLTEQSVGKLFIAAVGPGILLTGLLCAAVFVMVWKWPGFAGHPQTADDVPVMSAGQMLRATLPLTLLILATFGGIYGGLFTATEAGAVGALGAFVIALVGGHLNRHSIRQILLESGASTSSICILIIAANMYSRLIAISGVPGAFTDWMAHANLGYYGLIFAYIALLLFLGTALDSISTVLLSVPLLLPTFVAYHMDLAWIGIITILATEMGIVTPPLGISAFVVKSSLQDRRITLHDIYVGSYPFIGVMALTLVLLVLFPGITTGLLK
jgi:tripartite ATP-independent transporter DctM subunit